MKVLIVCSKNSGRIAPFIQDQVDALMNCGITCAYFTIEGKGIRGYLRNIPTFNKKILEFHPDLIHAHYGLSGLLANMQRTVPVVTTYHGSDINVNKVFMLSRVNMLLSAFNIFVSQKNILKSNLKSNFALIPCGVDTEIFRPIEKEIARKQLGINPNEKLVLFAGAFTNTVKNPVLAQAAVALLPHVRLLELKGFTRNEVAWVMNAVDVCLMTSHTEGSPQFIKEAMACNCPVVSVAAGDVPEVIDGVDGCFLSSYNENEISEKLHLTLSFGKKTIGRKRIIDLGWDSKLIAEKIIEIYKFVLSRNKK